MTSKEWKQAFTSSLTELQEELREVDTELWCSPESQGVKNAREKVAEMILSIDYLLGKGE